MALILEDGEVSLRFEDGTIAGIVGPDGAGKGRLLRTARATVGPGRSGEGEFGAARAAEPAGSEGAGKGRLPAAEKGEGEGQAVGEAVLVEVGRNALEKLDAAMAAQARVVLVDHVLGLADEAARRHYERELVRLARKGSVVVVASHDLAMLERLCDVVVAMEDGKVVEQGDPGLVLGRYRRSMLVRARAQAGWPELEPRSRHGDGRAQVRELGVEPATARSGEEMTIRARLEFHEAVAAPVVGMQIRSRIGVVVYGTNTELEQVEVGARRKGETLVVEFRFRCELCPGEYTVTVASHDPDGTAHDWLEDAVLFTVIDDRYTAGVANLRAVVTISPG